jgi:hypothetical protein
MEEANQVELAFAVCVDNTGYEVSLELYKIYRVLPDKAAFKDGYLRVIDESGEDYLYPEAFFVTIEPSEKLRTALLRAA